MRPHRRISAAVFVALALVGAGCSEGTSLREATPASLPFSEPDTTAAPTGSSGGTLRLGLVGVDALDPVKANPASASSMVLADLLFDGLTGYDETSGEVRGALAASWGLAADGLTWRFELAPDATFADGTKVEPTDVKASIERVAASGDAVLSGARLQVIAGYDDFVAKRTGEITGLVAHASAVEVRLRTPYGALPELFADPAFGVVKASEVRAGTLDAAPTASGPFSLRTRTAEALVLVRSPGSGASLAGVDVRIFGDAAAAHAAFEKGELDLAPVPADKVAAAAPAGSHLVATPQQVSVLYGMNVTAPALADVRMRRAILRAVDRDALRAQLFPGAAALAGVIGPGVAGRRADACGAGCMFDLAAAKALVAEAFPNGAVPTLHVDHFDDPSGREGKLAAAIAASLQAAGIPAQARAHSVEQFQALLVSGGAELFRYGWVGSFPSPDAYLAPFESTSVDNVFSLRDEALDAALVEARRTTTEPARTAAYAAAEDRVLALAPVVPLVQHRSQYLVRDAVQDLAIGPDGSFDARRVSLRQ